MPPQPWMLRTYDILDTPVVRELNIIVHQAAAATGTGMALISLLDEHRQWFKAAVGITAETFITSPFCSHAIWESGVFFVPDAARDPRFAQNPLVFGEPHIRFFAAAALQLDSVRVGTLCVLDDQPRGSFSPLQEQYLIYLAARSVTAIEAHHRGASK